MKIFPFDRSRRLGLPTRRLRRLALNACAKPLPASEGNRSPCFGTPGEKPGGQPVLDLLGRLFAKTKERMLDDVSRGLLVGNQSARIANQRRLVPLNRSEHPRTPLLQSGVCCHPSLSPWKARLWITTLQPKLRYRKSRSSERFATPLLRQGSARRGKLGVSSCAREGSGVNRCG